MFLWLRKKCDRNITRNIHFVILSFFVCISPMTTSAEEQKITTPLVSKVSSSSMRLTYQGIFRVPFHQVPFQGFRTIIAHDGEKALYYGGGVQSNDIVGKMGVVSPLIPQSKDLSNVPIANDLIAPVAVTRGKIKQIYDGKKAELNGLAVANGRLYINHGRFYDVSNEQDSGFASVSLDLSRDDFQGFYPFDVRPAKILSGYIVAIPAHWELRRHFHFLIGDYWNSGGGGPNTRGAVIGPDGRVASRSILSYYSKIGQIKPDHPVVPDFTKKDRYWGAFAITVKDINYFGVTVAKGTPPGWYGPPVNDSITDHCFSSKGYHAYPYKAQLYFYNEQDLLKSLKNFDTAVKPMMLDISQYMFNPCNLISGATTYKNTLYILESSVDNTRSQYVRMPVIHVFTLD